MEKNRSNIAVTSAAEAVAAPLPGSPVQEHHIDFLLEEEFCCNPLFLSYFLGVAQEQFENREGHPAGLFTPQLSSPCQTVRSVTSDKGETDVLVIYASNEAGRIAILIENKIRAGFQPEQAERYRTRGEAGRRQHWDHFWTCLIAPDRYAVGKCGFDTRVSISKMAEFFSGDDARSRFKAGVFKQVLRRFEESGLQTKDEAMTSFRAYYAHEAALFFALGEVEWPKSRDAWWGDTWFNFKGGKLPKTAEIVYKAGPGFVDLAFRYTKVEALKELQGKCGSNAEITAVQTGKSAALRLQVHGIPDFKSAEAVRPVLLYSLNCVRTLLAFYEENRELLSTL